MLCFQFIMVPKSSGRLCEIDHRAAGTCGPAQPGGGERGRGLPA